MHLHLRAMRKYLLEFKRRVRKKPCLLDQRLWLHVYGIDLKKKGAQRDALVLNLFGNQFITGGLIRRTDGIC
jgi:hypothetical protein